jgi:pyrroline-5-carboxylate reductase
MPLQRDDSDERIARLEKMMEEARGKSTPEAVQEQAEHVVDAAKPPQAKAVIRKSARKTAGGAKPE